MRTSTETGGRVPFSSASTAEAGKLRVAGNQAEQPLIKATLKPDSAAPAALYDTSGENSGKPSLRVSFEEPASKQSTPMVQASEAEDAWTVIQSDGSDSEYSSKSGAKLGLVRVKSAIPEQELPQQVQGTGLLQTALSHSLLTARTMTGDASQLAKQKLPRLKVPLTGMGRPRVAARRGTPRFVAEGLQDTDLLSGNSSCSSPALSTPEAAISQGRYHQMLVACMQAQPTTDQEEEAAFALRKHLSMTREVPNSSTSSSIPLPGSWCPAPPSAPQHAQHGNTAQAGFESLPVAEGRESIAAFNPSWHLRANQDAPAEEQPDFDTGNMAADEEDSLDRFYRPAGGLPSKSPQHQPSMVEQAGCLNFGSHVVAKAHLPQTQWEQSLSRKSAPRERSAIDDAALSSEDSEYEEEYTSQSQSQAQAQADSEAGSGSGSASQSRGTNHGSHDVQAEGSHADVQSGQGRYEAGQYADYHSEEGQSEDGQYAEGQVDEEGLDQSLDVLPAGITSAPEVYSPMSCGASRVRSMITNRPFMLEEPVSPVAQRRGATMRRGSQLTLNGQAESLGDSVALQASRQHEEPLYHDWSQPAQSLRAPAAVPAAPAPMSEAELAAELQIADTMRRKGKKSNPDAIKTGAISKLTGSLFRRSGKKTAETQTTEYQEDGTQTSDQPEPEPEAASQELVPAAGHPELGQELSFGDALKTQAAAPAQVHYGDLVLSDLIEAHGPLAMTAMSSPTHTSAFVLPAEQTSPAQLAGLADDTDPSQGLPSHSMTQHRADATSHQLALADLTSEATAGDMMTFQVDGQIKLGLRPRQLTFSASAQPPPPQLRPQLQEGGQTSPDVQGLLTQQSSAAHSLPPHAGQPLSPVPLLQSAGASTTSNVATASEVADWCQTLGDPAAPQAADATLQANQPYDSSSMVQHQTSDLPTAAAVSRQPSLQAAGATTAAELGQELTSMAPSLSWPGPATAVAAPSRQNSAGASVLSKQPSAVAQPASRQLSAVVCPPSRQGSAAAPPLVAQPSAVVPPPSRQASAVAAGASSQSSGLPLPVSRQSSGVVPNPSPPALSRQPSASATQSAVAQPRQTAASDPRQGLEQAWAALLPSLLAEANRQGHDSAAAVPVTADLPAASRAAPEAAAPVQTVGDILRMWAPVPEAMPAGLLLPPAVCCCCSLCCHH